MAQVSVDISVENIAGMINRMDVKELETLCLLLNDEGVLCMCVSGVYCVIVYVQSVL